MRRLRQPIGVVLAGGSGRRLGGHKALVRLRGRPLITYPLEALRGALEEVVVLAKADTALPDLAGLTVWIEPDEPRHPLAGLRQALALAQGRPVLACAGDLPLVGAELVGQLGRVDPAGRPAVIATAGGRIQPLLGLYLPASAALLERVAQPGGPLTASIEELGPRLVEVDDERALFNVNTPEQLLQAAALLDAGGVAAGLSRR